MARRGADCVGEEQVLLVDTAKVRQQRQVAEIREIPGRQLGEGAFPCLYEEGDFEISLCIDSVLQNAGDVLCLEMHLLCKRVGSRVRRQDRAVAVYPGVRNVPVVIF